MSVDQVEVTGHWEHEGRGYEDKLVRVTVVGDAVPENDAFIRQFKETLKERFEQKEIWITGQHVDLF